MTAKPPSTRSREVSIVVLRRGISRILPARPALGKGAERNPGRFTLRPGMMVSGALELVARSGADWS